MCGRYAASRDADGLVEEFEVGSDETGGPLTPSWNVAPTDTAPVVLERHPRPVGDHPPPVDRTPTRRLRAMRWGLVPSWAKSPSVGARMINARVETLMDKGAFRRAAATRRCLVPADGWYEWQASPVAVDARGKARKQPFFMSRRDGSTTALAGVYEFWRPADADPHDHDAWLTTFAVLTRPAERGLDRIHDRMPVVLDPQVWARWLDPTVTEPDDVAAMLTPPPAGRFLALPVSADVGSVRNDSPELVRPLPLDALVGVVDPLTGELVGARPS